MNIYPYENNELMTFQINLMFLNRTFPWESTFFQPEHHILVMSVKLMLLILALVSL